MTVPLAPRMARAIDLAIGERTEEPVDRHATYIVAACLAGAAS